MPNDQQEIRRAQLPLKPDYSIPEKVTLHFRENSAGVQALADTSADLEENRVRGRQQTRKTSAAPKPQRMQRGFPWSAVPVPASLKVRIRLLGTRRSPTALFGLAASFCVRLELDTQGSAAGLDDIQSTEQRRLVALEPPGPGLQETQRRLEPKWSIHLHTGAER